MRSSSRLLLLLIVLTALRGLVGPAMAAGMALPQMAAGSVHAAMAVEEPGQEEEKEEDLSHAMQGHDHGAGSASMAQAASDGHCHGGCTAQQAGDTPTSSSASPHAHTACADCEICHTVLLAPGTIAPALAARHAGRLPAADTRFVSAGSALPLKPPISS